MAKILLVTGSSGLGFGRSSRSFKKGKKARMFCDPLIWRVAGAKTRFGPR